MHHCKTFLRNRIKLLLFNHYDNRRSFVIVVFPHSNNITISLLIYKINLIVQSDRLDRIRLLLLLCAIVRRIANALACQEDEL